MLHSICNSATWIMWRICNSFSLKKLIFLSHKKHHYLTNPLPNVENTILWVQCTSMYLQLHVQWRKAFKCSCQHTETTWSLLSQCVSYIHATFYKFSSQKIFKERVRDIKIDPSDRCRYSRRKATKGVLSALLIFLQLCKKQEAFHFASLEHKQLSIQGLHKKAILSLLKINFYLSGFPSLCKNARAKFVRF